MTLNIVTKREAPLPPYGCTLISIEPIAVPFMLSALALRASKYWWDSPDDQMYGRWLMNLESARLLMPCGNDIVNSIDRVYNLLDATIRGTSRSVSGEGTEIDPYVYDPVLTQVTEPLEYFTPGLQYNSEQTLRAMENIVNGTTSTNYPDARNIRQLLEDILAAIQAEDFDPADIENLLNLILLALG